MSLARAVVSGIVTSEPEKRFTPNNFAVTNFTLQVNQTGRNEAPFTVRVTCWRNLADVVAEKLCKGDEATVEGRLQVNQYEASGGITKRTYEIDASNVYLGQLQSLAPASDAQGSSTGSRSSQSFASKPQQGAGQQVPVGVATSKDSAGETLFQEDLLTEDDIPF